MTKSFWKNWQRRIGSTKNIKLFWTFPDGRKQKSLNWILNEEMGDKIINADFNNDSVVLTIERHKNVFNWNTYSLKKHVENEYKTINREEIATIKFFNY